MRILERLGVIAREWIWGHDGGRVIVITLQLAAPRPKAEARPRPARGPPTSAPAPIPNVPPIKGATAEQVAEAKRRIDAQADAGADGPALTPEGQAAIDAFWVESRKRREAAARAAEAAEARAKDPPPKRTREELLAQIAARRPEPPPDGRPPDPGRWPARGRSGPSEARGRPPT